MEIIAGLITGIAIVGLGYATWQGRSLPFYGSVLIAIALAYVLFAVMAGTPRTIIVESAIATGFVAVAVAGTRSSTLHVAALLIAGGLAAHGGYDLVHSAVVSNPVVPTWWALFCGGVDIVLGAWVLVLLDQNTLRIHPAA